MAEDEAPSGGGGNKRRRLILIAGAAIGVGLLAGAGLYLSGILSPAPKNDDKTKDKAATPAKPHELIFVPLPDLLVNLDSAARKAVILKLDLAIQVGSKEDEEKIKGKMALIVDTCQTYLREVRPEDLHGSAGFARMHDDLLVRIRAAVDPTPVEDLLVLEMVSQ